MDLQSLVAVQFRRENQLRFDAEAYERAILRAERRRLARRALWGKIAGKVGAPAAVLRARAAEWRRDPAAGVVPAGRQTGRTP